MNVSVASHPSFYVLGRSRKLAAEDFGVFSAVVREELTRLLASAGHEVSEFRTVYFGAPGRSLEVAVTVVVDALLSDAKAIVDADPEHAPELTEFPARRVWRADWSGPREEIGDAWQRFGEAVLAAGGALGQLAWEDEAPGTVAETRSVTMFWAEA